jgi:hypothetical protein
MQLNEAERARIARIQEKIPQVYARDPHCVLFGAEHWKYQWPERASEATIAAWEYQHGITLPRAYRLFLRYVANGGPCYASGLHLLDETWVKGDLGQASLLPLRLTPQHVALWQDIPPYNDEGHHLLHNGLLGIGFNNIFLVVTGQYRGRLLRSTLSVWGDAPFTIDTFTFIEDTDFLSWYERWQDDVIAGLDMETFGVNVPGNQAQLRALFQKHKRCDILYSLGRFPSPEPETLALWGSVCRDDHDADLCESALRQLIRVRAATTAEMIRLHLNSPDARREKAVHLLPFAEKKGIDITQFAGLLATILGAIQEPQALSEAIQLLQKTQYNRCDVFAPLFSHVHRGNILWLSWAMTQAEDFGAHSSHIALFKPLFDHPDVEVCKQAIYALYRVSDSRIPPWVDHAATRFPQLASVREDYYRWTWGDDVDA